MDILHPTRPAAPFRDSTSGQAALEDAKEHLSDFQKLSKEVTTEATELHKAAKDLVKEVHFNIEQGNAKVSNGEWTKEQLAESHANLAHKQETAWRNLLANGEAVRLRIEGPYKLVVASRDNVTRARGDGITCAVFGFTTKDQKEVRKVFDNKMKRQFEEAAEAYHNLTSYPDGLLTQIHLLQKKTLDALKVNSSNSKDEAPTEDEKKQEPAKEQAKQEEAHTKKEEEEAKEEIKEDEPAKEEPAQEQAK